MFYLDLDRFKTINDTLGHAIGDAMLIETAHRLQAAVRATDLVARLGGDEFAILQTDLNDPASASKLAEHIRQRMRLPMVLDGNELSVTTSIGICTWRDAGLAPGSIAINLSLLQVKNVSELVQDITATTSALGLQPADLEFDVTEAMLAQLTLLQNDALLRLHALGCKIGIDNFGADYSTFDYIRKHEVSHLKLSGEGFHSALVEADRATALRAILLMAAELGLEVVLEGVDPEVHKTFLQELGQSSIKAGYYYSQPLDGSEAATLLDRAI